MAYNPTPPYDEQLNKNYLIDQTRRTMKAQSPHFVEPVIGITRAGAQETVIHQQVPILDVLKQTRLYERPEKHDVRVTHHYSTIQHGTLPPQSLVVHAEELYEIINTYPDQVEQKWYDYLNATSHPALVANTVNTYTELMSDQDFPAIKVKVGCPGCDYHEFRTLPLTDDIKNSFDFDKCECSNPDHELKITSNTGFTSELEMSEFALSQHHFAAYQAKQADNAQLWYAWTAYNNVTYWDAELNTYPAFQARFLGAFQANLSRPEGEHALVEVFENNPALVGKVMKLSRSMVDQIWPVLNFTELVQHGVYHGWFDHVEGPDSVSYLFKGHRKDQGQ